jgi:putative alpha-1,2-mannosidase
VTIDRRTLLSSSTLALFASAVPWRLDARPTATAPNLFVGTGGDGHTYPGPTLPFGMVQLGPDTDVERWATCSGYHHGDSSIMGFSHTHLSGTGIGDMLDVLVVPSTGPVKLIAGPLDNPDAGYRQRYSNEIAEPGSYRVTLESGVHAELTTTDRTGWHRYTYPKGICRTSSSTPRTMRPWSMRRACRSTRTAPSPAAAACSAGPRGGASTLRCNARGGPTASPSTAMAMPSNLRAPRRSPASV